MSGQGVTAFLPEPHAARFEWPPSDCRLQASFVLWQRLKRLNVLMNSSGVCFVERE